MQNMMTTNHHLMWSTYTCIGWGLRICNCKYKSPSPVEEDVSDLAIRVVLLLPDTCKESFMLCVTCYRAGWQQNPDSMICFKMFFFVIPFTENEGEAAAGGLMLGHERHDKGNLTCSLGPALDSDKSIGRTEAASDAEPCLLL